MTKTAAKTAKTHKATIRDMGQGLPTVGEYVRCQHGGHYRVAGLGETTTWGGMVCSTEAELEVACWSKVRSVHSAVARLMGGRLP